MAKESGPMQLEFHQIELRYRELRADYRQNANRLLASLAEYGQQAPVLVVRSTVEGMIGISQVTGSSSSNVPWSYTPPGVPRPSPYYGQGTAAFSYVSTFGTRNILHFVAAFPTARTFACLRFAEPVTRERRKAHYRPAGLSISRAGFAPAGRLIRIS